MNKAEALRLLALRRKADRLPGYDCLSDFHEGAYDAHDYVSPWTISAHDVDARLMVLLQDWSSSESLSAELDSAAVQLGHTPTLQTNVALKSLVGRHFGLRMDQTYVSNLFVFIKRGRISARIPLRDAVYCAKTYAIPQIEIVRPRVVLCVGLLTFNALRIALGHPRVSSREAPRNDISLGPTRMFGVPHTGAWGTRNAGGIEAVNEVWHAIAAASAQTN